MASGAILGICHICDELISEDEWDIFEDNIIHERCKTRAAAEAMKITKGHNIIINKINKIENEINELKSGLANEMDYYNKRISELMDLLNKIKGAEVKNEH